jgi:hypothetical protein
MTQDPKPAPVDLSIDFSAYDPTGKTARFNLPIRGALVPDSDFKGEGDPLMVEKQPVLIGYHAGDTNRPYMNGVARMTTKAVRNIGRRNVTPQRIIDSTVEDRDQDRKLFADHVLTGWEGMPGGPDRAEVPFSRAACRQVCSDLPAWLFDRVRTFFKNPGNFVDDDDDALDAIPDDEDVERQAGN